jgi:hypothetical protein
MWWPRLWVLRSVGVVVMESGDFPPEYKARMVAAYPVIAGLSHDEAWLASPEEREEAFERVLNARNLRRTHELFLQGRG